jgi:hypothetical protein
MFDRYDADQSGELDQDELKQWMLDLFVNDTNQDESPSTLHLDNLGPPTSKSSKLIISAHDDNDDQLLSYSELEHWVSGGARLLYKQKKRYSNRGKEFAHAVRFLEQVIVDSTKKETIEDLQERKDMVNNTINNTSGSGGSSGGNVNRGRVISQLNEGEYVWDITNHVLGFVLNEYHEVIEICIPSSCASMGDVSVGKYSKRRRASIA